MESEKTNGAPKAPPKIVVQLEVFRVKLGETHHVRMLSPAYGGLITHWYKGQSRYCAGKTCNPMAHREDPVWKGYCAAQVWIPPQPGRKGVWKPVVFEITEALELDLRDIYRRGQIWEVFRIPTDKKDNPPTCGQLLEEHDPATFAADFEIRPVLMNMYHTISVDLSAKNPMPPRMFGAPEEAAPPAKLDTANNRQKQDEDERNAELKRIYLERQKAKQEANARK